MNEKPFNDLGVCIINGDKYFVGRLWNGKELITSVKEAKASGDVRNFRWQNDRSNMNEKELNTLMDYFVPLGSSE